MQLESVAVQGFRSIAELNDVQIGSPTLLTGHNDAGKSAFLDAIRFLLSAYELTDRDPTYKSNSESPTNGAEPTSLPVERVELTTVVGTFCVSPDEQAELALNPTVRIRRTCLAESSAVYEIESSIPDDERLQDVETLGVPALKARVKELELKPTGPNKPELVPAKK